MFNSLLHIFPAISELILSSSALISLVIGSFNKKNAVHFTLSTVLLGLILLSIFLITNHQTENFFWNGLFIQNPYSIYSKTCLYLISSVCIFCFFSFINEYGFKKFEWLIIALFTIVGGSVAISSNHFLTLFIGLEISYLCQYLLVAAHKKNPLCTEAAIKYFTLGSIGTGFMLFGISLIYGFTGTNVFNSLFYFFNSPVYDLYHAGAIVGMLFIIISLCLKLPVAPFHSWAPDVYQAVPLPVLLFIGTVPKLITLFSLLHLLTYPFREAFTYWRYLFIGLSILSMIWGAFAALRQQNLLRLFAYSAVMNMGFLLIGPAMGGETGLASAIIYGLFYVLTIIGIFSLLMIFERTYKPIQNISDLSGIMHQNPILGGLFVVLILSLAGIPPLPGFFAKFYILTNAIHRGAYGLAIIAILTTVISTAYYLNILKFFVLTYTNLKSRLIHSLRKYIVKAIIILIFLSLVIVTMFPAKIIEIIHRMAVSTLFE